MSCVVSMTISLCCMPWMECAISDGSQSLASDTSLRVLTLSRGTQPLSLRRACTSQRLSEGVSRLSRHQRQDNLVSTLSLSPTANNTVLGSVKVISSNEGLACVDMRGEGGSGKSEGKRRRRGFWEPGKTRVS